jgi:D-tyrosyl-tRNA(Tyr) deacylase
MTAVIQRVKKASVVADGEPSGAIGQGLYILLGISRNDNENDALLLAEKISKLRIFSDENGKMNLSVNDIDGEVLVVSNFTLCANYSHGNRPDYFNAELPERANQLYMTFINFMRERVRFVASGKFGADMISDIVTDGPVTIVMQSDVLKGGKR